MGAGVTIYHGIHGLLNPEMPQIGKWTVAVLLFALVAEGISFMVAFKEKREGDTANLAVLLIR